MAGPLTRSDVASSGGAFEGFADADFRAYVAALDAALGQPLSRKHWKAVLASKRGDSQYER